MKRVVTIGVYGSTLDEFLAALRAHGVALVIDVRQRRGVRGREYAWANARRLEAALEQAGVEYQHRKDLAPTTELRQLQYAEDDRRGEGKRSRTVLAPAYVERYLREILDEVDLAELVAGLPDDGATALLCVERDAAACHRSVVAAAMADECGVAVEHVVPGMN